VHQHGSHFTAEYLVSAPRLAGRKMPVLGANSLSGGQQRPPQAGVLCIPLRQRDTGGGEFGLEGSDLRVVWQARADCGISFSASLCKPPFFAPLDYAGMMSM